MGRTGGKLPLISEQQIEQGANKASPPLPPPPTSTGAATTAMGRIQMLLVGPTGATCPPWMRLGMAARQQHHHHQVGQRLPVILQFHGGAFVAGSNDSVANDVFCWLIAKLWDMIVIAVGYRLAPECRYPAAFNDRLKVLNWLAKQANLAECSKSRGNARGGGGGGAEMRRLDVHRHIVDPFGASMVEPWLASHGDPST